MEFTTHPVRNNPATLEVRYVCDCGCKPRARYQQGAAEAGHEHCCCGRVHFVGNQAAQQMEAYISARRQSGEDLRHYTVTTHQVPAPWGPVPVAFGEPDTLAAH
ncbi:MAG: hypothetical protein HY532_00880 [Chloroflexi bacterium]|nr:hypothetical protein [Chloroflexota bacterium]